MIDNGKYKIGNLAKDFGLKSKDIIDLCNELGITGKTHTSPVNEEEFGQIIDKLMTSNQMADLNGYVMGGYEINDPGIVRLYTPKPAAQKPAGNSDQAKPKLKTDKPEVNDTSAKNEKKEARPVPEGQKKDRQQKEGKNENKETFEKKTPVVTVPIKEKVQPVDRFANRPDVGGVPKQSKKDNKQSAVKTAQPKKNQGGKGSAEISIADSTVATQVYTGAKARVVDTRTSDVDLSKYDEKLEAFVDRDTGSDKIGKQKVKKQNKGLGQAQSQSQQGGKGNQTKQGSQQQYGKNVSKGGGKKGDRRQQEQQKAARQVLNVQIPDEITVGELASMLKVTAATVIKKIMMLGVMANVNQVIDFDTAEYVATDLGAVVTKQVVVTIEDKLFEETEDKEEDLVDRAPVVCVMGHVDHGKTSILDRIRHTNVTAGEAGGITQAIGAYTVRINNKDITFLDTPGHEAFTAMRARGAMATDIAILVVAADDGIMPQTIEAINHAKTAGVDIIVAINKIDKPGANPETVKQELTAYELIPEEWGGDVICVPVSALTGEGIENLLESVLLVAELKALKANPSKRAKGLVIEAKLDKGRGPVATVLVQDGTLKAGDIVIAGTAVGRVRAMSDDKGKMVKSAGPSVPVEIFGLSEVPESGDKFAVVQDEKMARELAEERKTKQKDETFKSNAKVSLTDLYAQIASGVKELNIIIKADVRGSAEAVKASLLKLSNEEVKINVIHAAVGGIIEGDVTLAAASNAIIVGFNVRPDKNALDVAERQSVEIRTYRVIYECIDEIESAMKGMLAPTYEEKLLGHAEVRQTIRISSVGTIAGSYVQDGKITRNALIRVIREGVVIFEDKIDSLRRFKDDVREVAQGFECGIGLSRFNDIKIGDILEAYEMAEIKRI